MKAILVAILVLSANRAAEASAPSPVADVDVSVPHSELTRSQGTVQFTVEEPSLWLESRYGEGARFEFAASSWVPGSLVAGTHLSDASAVQGSGIPEVGLTFLTSPLTHWGPATLSLLVGASFGVFSRSGTFHGDSSTPARSIEENLYLLPIRIGAEGKTELSGPWLIYASLAAVPMVGFTTHTIFDDGQTVYGLPVEARLGFANDLRWLGAATRGILLKVGAVATASVLTTSDFSGLGAEAGVGFPL